MAALIIPARFVCCLLYRWSQQLVFCANCWNWSLDCMDQFWQGSSAVPTPTRRSSSGVLLSGDRRQYQLPRSDCRIGSDAIIPSTTVRDLGIYLTPTSSNMRSRIQRTVSLAVLRQLRNVISDDQFQLELSSD